MKRITLIKSLKKIVLKLDELDLPVTVEAFYGYGSALRGKESPGDLDLVLVYSMTEEQRQRWETFKVLFRGFIKETEKMKNLWKIQQEMSLPEYLSQEHVNQILEKFDIVTDWTKTYSWSNTVHQSSGFHPHFVEVTRRRLLKNIKGVQIFRFGDIEEFKPLEGWAKCYLLWSPESPDINKNFETVPVHEMVNEKIDDFIDEYEKEKGKLIEAQPEIIEIAKNVGIKLSFKKLNSLHPPIKYNKKNEQDKLEKCELARAGTKNCRIHRNALRPIRYVLSNERFFDDNRKGSKKEKLALAALDEHEKKYLKEKDLRNVLRLLDVPEDHIISMYSCFRYNGRCGTEFILESNPSKRKKLIKKVKIEKKRASYIEAIRKRVNKVSKGFWVYVEMDEMLPQKIEIFYDSWRNDVPISFFEENGFEITDRDDSGFYAECSVGLQGDESKKDILEKAMEKISK